MKPDARALLAEADEALMAAQEHARELGRRERELGIEADALSREVTAEQYQAGLERRAPVGVEERRARIAALRQEAQDVAQVMTGAKQAVVDAVNERARVLYFGFPEFAAERDAEEERLLARRAELEAAVAKQVADEEAQRAAWDELLRAVPMTREGVTFVARERIGVQTTAAGHGGPMLHPAFRPDVAADRLLVGYDLDPDWPKWLKDVYANTVVTEEDLAQADIRMARGPATFDSDWSAA